MRDTKSTVTVSGHHQDVTGEEQRATTAVHVARAQFHGLPGGKAEASLIVPGCICRPCCASTSVLESCSCQQSAAACQCI